MVGRVAGVVSREGDGPRAGGHRGEGRRAGAGGNAGRLAVGRRGTAPGGGADPDERSVSRQSCLRPEGALENSQGRQALEPTSTTDFWSRPEGAALEAPPLRGGGFC